MIKLSTRNIVPRATGEASLGTNEKKWGAAYINTINTDTIVLSNNNVNNQLTELAKKLTAVDTETQKLKAAVGTPLKASTVAAMSDMNKIYVYTGSESGYTAGNWYYYDSGKWVSGGIYNATAIKTDTSLSQASCAADAYAVGLKVQHIDDTILDSNYRNMDISTFETLNAYLAYTTLSAVSHDRDKYYAIPVCKGETYRIKCDGNFSGTPVFIYDDDGNKSILVDINSTPYNIYEFTMPFMGTLVINGSSTSSIYVANKRIAHNKTFIFTIDDMTQGSLQNYPMSADSQKTCFALLKKIPIKSNENLKITLPHPSGVDSYKIRYGFYTTDDAQENCKRQIMSTTETETHAINGNEHYVVVGFYPLDENGNGINNVISRYDGDDLFTLELDMTDEERVPLTEDDYKNIYKNIYQANDIMNLNPDIPLYLAQARRPANHESYGYKSNTQPLTLLHFSDLHGDSLELYRIIEFYKKIDADDIVCTGDMIELRWSSDFTFWNQVQDANKILLAIGNHDILTDETGWDWTKLATQADTYTRFLQPYIGNWGCTYTDGKTYYYKDYTAKKIRLIVLNCMLTPYGDEYTEQLNWLESVLASALDSGLHVVIATHYMPNTHKKCVCSYSTLDADNSATTLAYAYTTKVQQFIDNGGRFVCYLSGNTHIDLLTKGATYTKQINITVAAASVNQGNQYGDIMRVNGLKSQDLANLVTIDTASTVIKVIRVGADVDRYLRKKTMFSINYVTGEFL